MIDRDNNKILIFGGTTEGRELAGFCLENGIPALSSVATELGLEYLPEGAQAIVGRLDQAEMAELIKRGFSLVADATHPYAAEASANIRAACEKAGAGYYRVVRETGLAEYGETVSDTEELVKRLNSLDGVILSTLGSKEAAALTKVADFSKRVWLRILPSYENTERCVSLGFDRAHIICQKGPFSFEQNREHIGKSGAAVLVTKNSGNFGGYPEKVRAARECGVLLITLGRPIECGISLDEMKDIILKSTIYDTQTASIAQSQTQARQA